MSHEQQHQQHQQHQQPHADEKLTALQKHVQFFDANHDGLVTWTETYNGFRALDFNVLASVFAACVINFTMAYATSDSWWPTTTIRIRNIHRARHGSDMQMYDENGNFSDEKFRTFVERYDKNADGYLNGSELMEMVFAHRNVYDPYGWFAVFFEWSFFWLLTKRPLPGNEKHSGVAIDHIRGQYDGTLFHAIAADVAKKRTDKAAAAAAASAQRNASKSAPKQDTAKGRDDREAEPSHHQSLRQRQASHSEVASTEHDRHEHRSPSRS